MFDKNLFFTTVFYMKKAAYVKAIKTAGAYLADLCLQYNFFANL